MIVFLTVLISFVVLLGLLFLIQGIVFIIRKRRFPRLLDEASSIFKEFQYVADITLPLGLFLSINNEKSVEEVYDRPKNLEVAQEAVIHMLGRG